MLKIIINEEISFKFRILNSNLSKMNTSKYLQKQICRKHRPFILGCNIDLQVFFTTKSLSHNRL